MAASTPEQASDPLAAPALCDAEGVFQAALAQPHAATSGAAQNSQEADAVKLKAKPAPADAIEAEQEEEVELWGAPAVLASPRRQLKRLKRRSEPHPAPCARLVPNTARPGDCRDEQTAATEAPEPPQQDDSASGQEDAGGSTAAAAHRRARSPVPSRSDAEDGSEDGGGLPADYWDEEDELVEQIVKRKARVSTGGEAASLADARTLRSSISGSDGSKSGHSADSDAGKAALPFPRCTTAF